MKLKRKEDLPDDPPEEMSFEEWARAKYQEVARNINPCNDNGQLDPVRLNEVMTNLAQNLAWSITIQEVETNKLNKLHHEFEHWKKKRFNDAYRQVASESAGTRAPGITTVESRVADMFGEELMERQTAVDNQRSRVDLLKGFARVLEKQASMLQTLSSNMRSELFFAGGVSIGEGRKTHSERVHETRSILESAMAGQGKTEESSE